MYGQRVLNFKAVIIGWVVDMGGSLVFAGIVGVTAGIVLGAGGVSPEAIQARLQNSTVILLLSLMIGLAFTAVGGYVAARMAAMEETKHGFFVGVLAIVTGLVFTVFSSQSMPGWFHAASFVLTLPAAVLGGYIRSATK